MTKILEDASQNDTVYSACMNLQADVVAVMSSFTWIANYTLSVFTKIGEDQTKPKNVNCTERC